jgi:tripartite-type tricarboxylate transporter receptor subunit TctC
VDENPATKGYAVTAWTGLFAPRDTPKAVREKISADVREALATPEVTERYRAYDYELFDVGPDGFAEAIRNETRSWGDVIRASQLKLD